MKISLIYVMEFVAFLCSLFTLTKHLRQFKPIFYVMLVTGLAEILGFFIAFVFLLNNHWIFNISVPMVIMLLLFLFFKNFQTISFKHAVKVMAAVYVIFIVINFSLIQGTSRFSTYNYMAGGLLVSIASILYIIELMRKPQQLDLKSEPLFWMSIGIMMMYIPKSVLYSLYEFLFEKESLTASFHQSFRFLNRILSVIFYFSISIACTCRLMYQRSPKPFT